MVHLGGSVFIEMLGPFNPFKILNLVDDFKFSSGIICKRIKEKKDLPINTKEAKSVHVGAGINVIGKEIKD